MWAAPGRNALKIHRHRSSVGRFHAEYTRNRDNSKRNDANTGRNGAERGKLQQKRIVSTKTHRKTARVQPVSIEFLLQTTKFSKKVQKTLAYIYI